MVNVPSLSYPRIAQYKVSLLKARDQERMEKVKILSNREENGPIDLSIKSSEATTEKKNGTRCLRNTNNFLRKGKPVRNIEDFEFVNKKNETRGDNNFCFVASPSLLSSQEIEKTYILVDSRINKKQMEFSVIPFAMPNTVHFDKYSIVPDGIEEPFSLMELSDGQVCLVPLLSSVYNIAQKLSSIRNYLSETENGYAEKLSPMSCIKEKECNCKNSTNICFCDSKCNAVFSKRNSNVLDNTFNFPKKSLFSGVGHSSQSSSPLNSSRAKTSSSSSSEESLHFENWQECEVSLEENVSAEDLSVNKAVQGVKDVFRIALTSENLENFNSLKNFCHSYDDTASGLVQRQSPSFSKHSEKHKKLLLKKEWHSPSKPLASLPAAIKTIGEQQEKIKHDSETSNLRNLFSSSFSNSLPIHESSLLSAKTLNDREICVKRLHKITPTIYPWNVYEYYTQMSQNREAIDKHLDITAAAFTRTPFEAKGTYPTSWLPDNTSRYTAMDCSSHTEENIRPESEKLSNAATKQSVRVLTGKHVKFGAGASPLTLLTLRHKIQEKQKVKKLSVTDRNISIRRTNETIKKRRRSTFSKFITECNLQQKNKGNYSMYKD